MGVVSRETLCFWFYRFMWNMGGLGFELFGMISECAVPSPLLVVVRVGVSRETWVCWGWWDAFIESWVVFF